MPLRQLLTAPNQLTLMRLVFVPFIIISVMDGRWRWALALFILAGLSDALDGLLARALNQKTVFGMYLDPIADKLLLSSLFLVLSFGHKIPWKFTVLVFTRDVFIIATAAVLYAVTTHREFHPSIFGKMNTVAQVATLFIVLLFEVNHAPWIGALKIILLWLTFALTLISGVHYAILTSQRIKSGEKQRPIVG